MRGLIFHLLDKGLQEMMHAFELQRADEIWLSNATNGLQWVGTYRKKEYTNEKVGEVLLVLNALS